MQIIPTLVVGEHGGLDLNLFRLENLQRCEAVFHELDSWSPTDWACALAGEVGELCNLLKKQRRGDQVDSNEIAKEIADVLTYLDLLASRCGVNLSESTVAKFNEVSLRRGYERMMSLSPNLHRSTTPRACPTCPPATAQDATP